MQETIGFEMIADHMSPVFNTHVNHWCSRAQSHALIWQEESPMNSVTQIPDQMLSIAVAQVYGLDIDICMSVVYLLSLLISLNQ
jgi:hypothetical protein